MSYWLKIVILCLLFAVSALAQDAENSEKPEKPRRLMLPAPYERFDTPRFTDPPPPEPRGATYEDEIERRRREMRNPPPPPPPPPVRPSDPFSLWEPPAPRTGVQFHADASITQRDIFYWKEGNEYRYGTLVDLQNRFLSLPPPPAPPPITTIGQIWQNNPPPNTAQYYGPLLQFLQGGPGPGGLGTVGNLLTLAHLQQITPALLALAPALRQLQSGTLTLNQLALSPAGSTFLNVAQSILQPLGLWNSPTLSAWYYYILLSNRQQQLINILTTFEADILRALNLPPGQLVNVTNVYQPPPINPYAVIAKMNELWRKGDEEEIAAQYPDLAYSLIKHAGFSHPQGLLYGSRKGRKNSIFPYNVGIITEQRNADHREIWVLNESGFFVNETASGVGRYYQGPDDLTLSYVPFEVSSNKRITTLDVRASEDYTLLKRAVGGDVQIINRAATDTTGILYADLPFLGEHLHLRPFVGTTAYATTSGMMFRVDYGTDEIFKGHVGGGAGYRQTMFSSQRDDLINYLETENVISLRSVIPSLNSSDGERGLRLWPSLTLAASSMLTKPVGEGVESRWTLQAETRVIPELHTQLATPYALFSLWGGVTTAIVPGGNLNLKNPEKTLSLYPIRSHVGLTCRIKFSDVINPSPYYIELGGITEFSQLVDNTRIGARFGGGFFYLDYLIEVEKYHDTSFTDIRMGGGVGCYGISFQFLQSLKDNDYRAQASIDVMALIDLEENLPTRGFLSSF